MLYLYLILFLTSHSQATIGVAELTSHVVTELDKNKAKRTKTLIAAAKKLKGTKYKYGGQSRKGMDCSGFIHHIYSKVNIDLPRSTSLQVSRGKKVRLNDTKAGDLIFFQRNNKVNHVAMVVHHQNNQLIIVHATSTKGVIFENLNSSAYWKNKYFVAKRLI